MDMLKQTICRKLSFLNKQTTIHVNHFIFIIVAASAEAARSISISLNYLINYFLSVCIITWLLKVVFTIFFFIVIVKKFVYVYNPQITNTRNFKFIYNLIYLYSLKTPGSFVSGASSGAAVARCKNDTNYKSNIIFNIGLSMLVGISEAIRLLFFNLFPSSLKKPYSRYAATVNKKYNSTGAGSGATDIIFNQWLAGLIDGDGCFQLSKKGYASLEIVMETRDKHCLYLIKQKFGGSVKLRSGVNWLRYRLHHKKGLLDLINSINGEIRNPIRLLQLKKICDKYNITLIDTSPLTYNKGWFSGFFDSDGSVYFNITSSQMFISATQKNSYILNNLVNLYGGTIYAQKESFKWVVYKKSEVINLLDYFKICPSKSAKKNRLFAIKRFYELKDLKAHLATKNSIFGKAWNRFLLKWDKWEKID